MMEWSAGPRLFEHFRAVPGPLRLPDVAAYVRSLGLGDAIRAAGDRLSVPQALPSGGTFRSAQLLTGSMSVRSSSNSTDSILVSSRADSNRLASPSTTMVFVNGWVRTRNPSLSISFATSSTYAFCILR